MVDSVKFSNEALFMPFAAIITARNGTESSDFSTFETIINSTL
jgi:hypothetical protein